MHERTITDQFAERPTAEAKDRRAEMAAYIEDLRDAIGPNADAYLRKYARITPAIIAERRTGPRKQRAHAQKYISKSVRGWNWPLFLVSVAWLLYRKMYLYAFLFVALPIIGGLLFPRVSAGPMLGLLVWAAIDAKGWYLDQLLAKMAKADALELTGTARSEYLQKAGGVSIPGAVLGGLIMGVGLVANVLYFVSLSAAR